MCGDDPQLTMRGVQWRRSMAEGRQPTAACPPRVYPCYPFRVGIAAELRLSPARPLPCECGESFFLSPDLKPPHSFYNEPLIGICNPFSFGLLQPPPCDSRVMRGMCVALYCRVGERQCVCGVCVSVWCVIVRRVERAGRVRGVRAVVIERAAYEWRAPGRESVAIRPRARAVVYYSCVPT